MNNTMAARGLMGDSLGFHILFALLGVGIPLLILLAELIAIVKADGRWFQDARRWTEVLVLLFVTGAISGTIISTQMTTMWGPLMKLLEPATAPAFFLEGFAFLIEAIFLTIYLVTWPKKPHWGHLLAGLPIMLASATSAFFITTVNAFMNSPQGFQLKDGAVVAVKPLQTIFNPATATETSHSIIGYYLATAALFMGFYAWRGWRRGLDKHDKKRLAFLAGVVLIFSVGIVATGDASARYLVNHEPTKLAAAEDLRQTQAHAPLQIGGVVWRDHLYGSITVPSGLSILAKHSPNAVITGLDKTPPSDRPSLIIHFFLEAMVAAGSFILLVSASFLLLNWRKSKLAYHVVMLWALAACALLGLLAVEFGWLLTEIGRQPYAIHGILRTRDAATAGTYALRLGTVFPLLYLALFGVTFWALKQLRKRWEAK